MWHLLGRLAMKIAFVFICLLLTSCASRQYGYLMFDFYSVDDESRKDYWIGLNGSNLFWHLHARIPVHRVPVGNYEISHFDRSSDLRGTHDDLDFAERDVIKFRVMPYSITYLGVFTLEKADDEGNYAFQVLSGGGLMQRACDEAPELFARYRVNLALVASKPGKGIKYDCVTGAVE